MARILADLSILCSLVATVLAVTIPPHIIKGPDQEVPFKEGESVELSCVAEGDPEPTYKWLWNNMPFDPSGKDGRVAVQPGVGTLIFSNPIKVDEGIYQCFAENAFGISLSQKANMRISVLAPFPSLPVITHRPPLGNKLMLKCTPPVSYPRAEIFWSIISPGERFKPLDTTDRVSLDHEGSLHFSNVIRSDNMNDATYVCTVQNKFMRNFVQGFDAKIDPLGVTVGRHRPEWMWTSPTRQLALRGTVRRIKCIASGSPTPRVDWARLDGNPMPDRAHKESFGQELVIEGVEMSDAGKYECSAINDEWTVPIRKSFDLIVESGPYWVEKPESINVGEQETGTFTCVATGYPQPTIEWFINGVALSKVPGNRPPRVKPNENTITFYNLTKTDTLCIQCNATNNHGYIWGDAYLNILSEAPKIFTNPEHNKRVAEGQKVNLTCEVFGAPKPLIVWKRGYEQLTGGKYKIYPNGYLEIDDVSSIDAGYYTCIARNRFGEVSANGSVIVRRKTEIQTAPLDVTVYAGTEAKFTCTATTDPEEVGKLNIEWKKDDALIDYQRAQRVFKNVMDNSLTISGAIPLDTGKYTCVASNGLDVSEASAQLVVQDRPDAPTNIDVKCGSVLEGEKKATVAWQPSKENYAPILNFIVQSNTTFTQDTWFTVADGIPQNQHQIIANLSAWGNYTFRVLARNKIGISPPSEHSIVVCSTKPDRPDTNPENVRTEGATPSELVIRWTATPMIEQNAPGFYYVVAYKRHDQNNLTEWVTTAVLDPKIDYYVVPNQPTFQPYELYVKAANSIGESYATAKTITGYSGEDLPLDSPGNFQVDPNFPLKAKEAVFIWDKVNTSPERIRGFFKGYRIQYFKTSEGESYMREKDILVQNFTMTTTLAPVRKRRQVPVEFLPSTTPGVPEGMVRGIIRNLPAFTKVTVRVVVLNQRYHGPASGELVLNTPEGVPGPVPRLDVLVRGSNHFELRWAKPQEPNGILTGYDIAYQHVSGLNLGIVQTKNRIRNPDQLRGRLAGLEPDRTYRVYIRARTKMGKGEDYFIDVRTTPPGRPTPPSFIVYTVNNTAINVTWTPSKMGTPGSVFYVQYRMLEKYQWENTADEVEQHWYVVPKLETGMTYEVRVVAKNGGGQEAPSDVKTVTMTGDNAALGNVAASAWFISTILVVLCIIGAVVLLFFCQKKRVEKYAVQEEERLRTAPSKDFASEQGYLGPGTSSSSGVGVKNDSYQYDSESDFKRSMQSSQSDFKMPLDDDSEYGPDYSDEDDDDKYYDDEDDEDEYGPDDDVHYTDDPIYDDPDPQGAVGGVAIAGHPRGDRKDPMDSFV